MSHLLLNNAKPYTTDKHVNIPEGFQYNNEKNAWYSEREDVYLVNHKDYPRVGTKKFDVETGEDQKGQ